MYDFFEFSFVCTLCLALLALKFILHAIKCIGFFMFPVFPILALIFAILGNRSISNIFESQGTTDFLILIYGFAFAISANWILKKADPYFESYFEFYRKYSGQ